MTVLLLFGASKPLLLRITEETFGLSRNEIKLKFGKNHHIGLKKYIPNKS
jgi:hypothetical protein